MSAHYYVILMTECSCFFQHINVDMVSYTVVLCPPIPPLAEVSVHVNIFHQEICPLFRGDASSGGLPGQTWWGGHENIRGGHGRITWYSDTVRQG